MSSQNIDASIIIVNWNTKDILRDCLNSVIEQTKDIVYEIIVVDNASADGSAQMVRKEFPSVILIENSENLGFAAANNRGIKASKGRYILLLNSDTIILNNAIAQTLSFADNNQNAAAVACKVLNPDMSLQSTCFMFPSLLNMILSTSYLYKLLPKSKFFGRERMTWWGRDTVREVDAVTGCFMLVRRSAVEKVGLMDERFFVYGEETDWCRRFKQAGWKVLFTPDTEIIHYGKASSSQARSEMTLQLRAGILLFIKKHNNLLTYFLCRILTSLFFSLRIPYWLACAFFGRTGRAECVRTAGIYTRGALKSLLGWEYLSVRKSVKSINTKEAWDGFVCFGGEDWWYHNRGHIDMQLMRNISKKHPTLYINSIVMQKPNIANGAMFIHKVRRKLKSIFRGLKKSEAGFFVYSPFSIPLHHIGFFRRLNELILRLQAGHIIRKIGIRKPVIWVACPAACDVAMKLRKARLVYQRTDRFEEFPNVDFDTIKRYDRRLKINADVTIFVNSKLYEQERGQCKNAIYLDHGVDFEMFASAEKDTCKPQDIADVARPIVGFYGGIDDHTSDIEFLKQVIDMLPEMNFVLVGNVSANCNGLSLKKNVLMLGQKPYEQIPHYGKCFDVAIMPWKQNKWIEACNPIKLKEYLALGKPIVSTPFPELDKYQQVVYTAKTPSEFADCISRALKYDNPKLIAERRKKVEGCTWENKALQALQELSDGA